MPPKSKKANKKAADQASKKAMQKKKEKLLEDKTFGLKNKNKSSKVQAYVKSTEKSIMNVDPNQRKLDEKKKQEKLANKARKKAEQKERDMLFNDALKAVQKKTTTKTSKGAGDAKGRDHDDDEGGKKQTSKAMKLMYQMDAKEAQEKLMEDPHYVPTIEDEIEKQRQSMFAKLRNSGKKGTPVNETTLKAWLEKKRKRRAEAAKKLVEAEMKKKKGGKGLSVLSGRDLYDYNKDLFRDGDDNDVGARSATLSPVASGALVTDDERGAGTGKGSDEDADIEMMKEHKDEEAIDPRVANKANEHTAETKVDSIADKVQSDLFLDGEDDDLDDIDDD